MNERGKLALTAALAALCGSVLAQTSMPSDLDPQSHARLPYLQRQNAGEGAERLFSIFVRDSNAPTDTLTGPLAFAAYNVPVANALLDLHDGAVNGSLEPDVRELAILVACRETNYDFEWNAHEPAAERAGVDPRVIDAVRREGSLDGLDDKYAAVIRFGRQLLDDRDVTSEAFAKARELFGDQGVMDLVAVMSTYAVSGFYAIAVDEHMPEGEPTLPPAK
jgi:4-carboxymuconolactone decarboxylase